VVAVASPMHVNATNSPATGFHRASIPGRADTGSQSRPLSTHSAIEHEEAALLRTRSLVAAEVDRMSALGDLLTGDASSIAQAQGHYGAYGAEVEESRARIQKLKVRPAPCRPLKYWICVSSTVGVPCYIPPACIIAGA